MYAQLTLGLGVEEKVGVRDLIVRGEIGTEATPKAKRERPVPEWECVLADGADCAFRRRHDSRSQLMVMLATQGQCYVLDERTGAATSSRPRASAPSARARRGTPSPRREAPARSTSTMAGDTPPW